VTPRCHIKCNNQRIVGQQRGTVLRIFPPEPRDRTVVLGAVLEEPNRALEKDEPEPPPILVIVVGENHGSGVGPQMADAAKAFRRHALGLGVNRGVDAIAP
jgi:hypothetical protein